MTASLHSMISKTALQPVPTSITTLADKIRAEHAGVLAILAYGSAFRDAAPADTLIDFYILTKDGSGVSSNLASRLGCRFVPPNVYYAECNVQGETSRAKYAVLPFYKFQSLVSRQTGNPYFWARFAQPCRIVWCLDATVKTEVIATLAKSLATAFANAMGLSQNQTIQATWTKLFEQTYRTELRPESTSRATQIFSANQDYFETVSRLLAETTPVHANWTWRVFQGKCLSVARLIKAAFTFQGGADYIAWKIKRHSGVAIEVKDWHRRHPLLAALVLMPQLLWRGAVK